MCYLSVFFFKQKTAYELRISDWSSDVCSSDLKLADGIARPLASLPQAAVAERVLPAVEPQYQASLAAALAAAGQQIAATEASPGSLPRYGPESGQTALPPEAVLPTTAIGNFADVFAHTQTPLQQDLHRKIYSTGHSM